MNAIPVHLTDSDGERNPFVKFIFHSIICPLPFFRFLGLMVILLILAGCAQRRVDAQMEELCRRDGGMKIYEQVPLPLNQFKAHGNPIFYRTWNTSGNGYTFSTQFHEIESGNPSLSKTTFAVIRESDDKVLGTYVTYLRIGGGIIPRPGPDPAKSCPTDASSNAFLNTVFTHD